MELFQTEHLFLGTSQAHDASVSKGTNHLWSVLVPPISSLGMLEIEPVSSSFVDTQQGSAQCPDCSKAWINALTGYVNELKENSRLFLHKMVQNWTGQETDLPV